eukprot:1920799-Amphidinium_carterae.1
MFDLLLALGYINASQQHLYSADIASLVLKTARFAQKFNESCHSPATAQQGQGMKVACDNKPFYVQMALADPADPAANAFLLLNAASNLVS